MLGLREQVGGEVVGARARVGDDAAPRSARPRSRSRPGRTPGASPPACSALPGPTILSTRGDALRAVREGGDRLHAADAVERASRPRASRRASTAGWITRPGLAICAVRHAGDRGGNAEHERRRGERRDAARHVDARPPRSAARAGPAAGRPWPRAPAARHVQLVELAHALGRERERGRVFAARAVAAPASISAGADAQLAPRAAGSRRSAGSRRAPRRRRARARRR